MRVASKDRYRQYRRQKDEGEQVRSRKIELQAREREVMIRNVSLRRQAVLCHQSHLFQNRNRHLTISDLTVFQNSNWAPSWALSRMSRQPWDVRRSLGAQVLLVSMIIYLTKVRLHDMMVLV